MRALASLALFAAALMAALLMDEEASQELADEALDMFGGERP